jgi:hypothetical protein
MSFLSRWFDWRGALVMVKPDTLIRWHRKGPSQGQCSHSPHVAVQGEPEGSAEDSGEVTRP